MGAAWYYEEAGAVIGPVTCSYLRQLARVGRLGTQARVRRGSGNWVTARRVKGLFPCAEQAGVASRASTGDQSALGTGSRSTEMIEYAGTPRSRTGSIVIRLHEACFRQAASRPMRIAIACATFGVASLAVLDVVHWSWPARQSVVSPTTVAAWKKAGAIYMHCMAEGGQISWFHWDKPTGGGDSLPGFHFDRPPTDATELPHPNAPYTIQMYGATDRSLGALAAHGRGLRVVRLMESPSVTEAGLRSLATLPDLERVAFWDVPGVRDDGLSTLCDKPRLRSLDIWQCGAITDRGIIPLARHADLEHFRVEGAGISDAGLLALDRHRGLADFSVAGCERVADEGVTVLARLSGLELLDLCGTKVTDEGLTLLR
jgi:hypothetical protein